MAEDEEDEDAEDEDAEEAGDDGDDGDGDEEGEGKKKGDDGGKKKLIIIVAAVLMLLMGGVGAAYFLGFLNPVLSLVMGPDAMSEGEMGPTFFDGVPVVKVDLAAGGSGKRQYIQMKIKLELNKQEDMIKVSRLIPRVMDNFNVYLRELRIEDLKGSAGMYRLREELLNRINKAAAPVRIKDVLFEEILVQ